MPHTSSGTRTSSAISTSMVAEGPPRRLRGVAAGAASRRVLTRVAAPPSAAAAGITEVAGAPEAPCDRSAAASSPASV